MNDHSAYVGVPTNGTGHVTDAEPLKPTQEGLTSFGPPSLAAPPRRTPSVDERLEALMETVRTWDWRAGSLEAGPPRADQATLPVSDLAMTATAEGREDSRPLTSGPYPLHSAADTRTVVLEPTPPHDTDPPVPVDSTDDTQTVVLEPMPPLVSSPSEPGPTRRADTGHGPIDRLWSHRWTKVAVLFLAAAVVVFLIIWGLRLTGKSPGASAPPPTTPPQHAAVHTTHHKAFVAPISTAQLAKYQQFARGLQTANAAATGVFVGAGSTPTTPQLAPAVAAYRSALNLYYFQLHFIQWPASMQPAITDELAQLSALVSFLQSISFVSPTGMSAWLSQMHTRTGTAQTADNEIRLDLGLPSSSSFPT